MPRLVVVLALLLAATSVLAQWPDDPAVNLPLSLADGEKYDVFAVTDGQGGAIVVWEDERAGDGDIYVQRVDAEGNVLWQADGVPVCTAAGDQAVYNSSTGTTGYTPLVADGSGGAWIVWHDDRAWNSTTRDVYAQRVNASGEILLASDGVAVASGAGMETRPTACSDGQGGVIVVWDDRNADPVFSDIYGQRLDADGRPVWNDGQPVPLVAVGWDQYGQSICSDGAGGAFVAWSDGRVDVGDVYVQHLDADGTAQWTPNGLAVCTRSGTQDAITARLSGDGDLLLAWVDRRGSGPDIYAQKLSGDTGAPRWTAGGFAATTAANSQYRPALCPDGSGGAIVAWFDYRNAPSGPPWNLDIFAQRITAEGAAAWTVGGISVCGAPDAQRDVDLVSDGQGGAFLAWEDNRGGTSEEDIYAQHLDASGEIQWAVDGVAVSTAPNNQKRPDLVRGGGGVIMVWPDDRDVLYESDVYAARVEAVDPTAAPIAPAAGLVLEMRGPDRLAFALPRAGRVTADVFDVRGRRVTTLVQARWHEAGWHELALDRTDRAGRPLPSGVYQVRVRSGRAQASRSFAVVR
jgi:hypothetical protein